MKDEYDCDEECTVLIDLPDWWGDPGDVVGICPADGRPIYMSNITGTIYHATEEG